MTERVKDIDQQVLALFSRSLMSRYEHWKRKDLFAIALQTMPKQVKTENVIDNIIKLKAEFAKRLDSER